MRGRPAKGRWTSGARRPAVPGRSGGSGSRAAIARPSVNAHTVSASANATIAGIEIWTGIRTRRGIVIETGTVIAIETETGIEA